LSVKKIFAVLNVMKAATKKTFDDYALRKIITVETE